MTRLLALSTHYEILNYTKGEIKALENELSIFDKDTFKLTTYYYYDEKSKVLYVPRGYDDAKLADWFGPITYIKDTNKSKSTTFQLKLQPRHNSQREGIRFLVGRDEYKYTKKLSQLALSLPGGAGKTYCVIAALSVLKMKSLIITHNTQILEQWVLRIKSYTDANDKQIMILNNSADLLNILSGKKKYIEPLENVSFFICTHSLMHSFIKSNGFERTNGLMKVLGVGVRVIDEAHKNFGNTLLMDYAMNIAKNFYVTATFGRSDRIEDMVFKRCFDRVNMLVQNDDTMGNVKTVFHIADFFRTHMNPIEVASMYLARSKRFSIQKYFTLEDKYGLIYKRMELWIEWFYRKAHGEGHMIIISPKKVTCDKCCKIAKEMSPLKKCCAHYSGHKVEKLEDYDIICATSSMLGTGFDMDDLSIIINMEPLSSAVNLDQLIHRLMRGKSTKDAYYIELIDASVKTVVNMFDKRKKTSKNIVKKIIEVGR